MRLRGEQCFGSLKVTAARQLALLSKIVHQRIDGHFSKAFAVVQQSQRGLNPRPQRRAGQCVRTGFRWLLLYAQRFRDPLPTAVPIGGSKLTKL